MRSLEAAGMRVREADATEASLRKVDLTADHWRDRRVLIAGDAVASIDELGTVSAEARARLGEGRAGAPERIRAAALPLRVAAP